MRILISEDDDDTALQYQIALEDRKHFVLTTKNGKECLEVYNQLLNPNGRDDPSHFDVVVLDYRMPEMNGMDVAKAILEINPKQRIIFASAYVKETLANSIRELGHVVELMQKPFELDTLVNTIEDEDIYVELAELNEYLSELKEFDLSQEQVTDLLQSLRNIQKGRSF